MFCKQHCTWSCPLNGTMSAEIQVIYMFKTSNSAMLFHLYLSNFWQSLKGEGQGGLQSRKHGAQREGENTLSMCSMCCSCWKTHFQQFLSIAEVAITK